MQKTVYYSAQPGAQAPRPAAPQYAAAMPQQAVLQRPAMPMRPVAPPPQRVAPVRHMAPQQPQVAAVPARPARAQAGRGLKPAPLVLVGCLALALFAVLLVPLMVGGAPAPASQQALPVQARKVQATVAYDTVQQAATALGISPAMPRTLPDGYTAAAIAVADDTIIEVTYSDGKDQLVLRTAAGSDDLSGGAQMNYLYTATETANDIARSYAGVSEKKLNLVVWATGGYSYTIYAEDGLEADQMRVFAESIQ